MDPTVHPTRKTIGLFALLIGSLATAFLLGELMLRTTVGGPARFLYGASFVDHQVDWNVKYGVNENNQRIVCGNSDNQNYTSRIALLGDSFVYGQGIPDCKDLASTIKMLAPDLTVENLALIGIGLREYRIILRDLVDKNFDRLYLLIYGNDVFEHPVDISLSGKMADTFSVFALLRKIKRARLIENFLNANIDAVSSDAGVYVETPFNNVKSILAFDKEYFFKSVNPSEDKLDEFRREFVDVINDLKHIIDPRRIFIAVVPEGATVSTRLRNFVASQGGVLPVYGKAGRVYEALRNDTYRLGVNYLETFDAYLECGDACYFPHDMHWNSRGSALMAELIVRDMEVQGSMYSRHACKPSYC